ncbi:glycosyltransferase 87 family protein [Amycolatopsis suaedae]|uniref:DUF2029 domain-containing protein n=1 Tax=Amycolatopsis suaedae TaxID=2510978 RepID=A0A4Q7J740_9PSEU|nr:glycosyltransferase 87 family protein [Amycolatopsis suaedae]RZQ62728.1 DUF2029 domain-containing protein [Amycolatopsis suaedae]
MSTRRWSTESARWWPAAVVAAAFAAGVAVWLAGWHLGADSAVYRAGALSFLRGEQLYTDRALSTLPSWVLLPFTYPPAAALLFTPLAVLPEGLAWGALAAGSAASLVVVVRLAARGSRLAAWPAVAGLSVLAVALEPVWKTFFLGQINLILMALVMADVLVLSARGSRWGGVLIGVAAAVKLTPLVFVAHLIVTGRWRDALRALATFAALQGLMFLLAFGDTAQYWERTASNADRIGAVHWIFNQSLHGLVARAGELTPLAMPVALAIGALLAVPAVWLVVRLHRRGEALMALLVTATFGLLVSPVSWTHHWVWTVPLVVLLLVRARYWAVVAVTAVFTGVVMLVPNGGRAEFGWGPLLSVPGNLYVVAATVGLLGLSVRELARLRSARG